MTEAKFWSWEGSKSKAEFELSCTLESTKYFPLSARPRAPQIPNLPTSAEPSSTSYPALQELCCSLPKQDIFVFDIKAASSGTSITLSRMFGGGGGSRWVPKVEPICSFQGRPVLRPHRTQTEEKFMKMT
ncbi:hypothetical protein PAMP_023277 [Pampus punctatissimus]